MLPQPLDGCLRERDSDPGTSSRNSSELERGPEFPETYPNAPSTVHAKVTTSC